MNWCQILDFILRNISPREQNFKLEILNFRQMVILFAILCVRVS